MIEALITVKVKSNHMSKDDFEMARGYSGKCMWRNYEEYFDSIKDPIFGGHTTGPIKFDTDDIEVAKFLLTKVEGLVTVHSITVI